MQLIIEIEEEVDMHARIDRAHASSAYSRGHSGLFVTMDQETMMVIFKNLGLLTNISTDIEIVFRWKRCAKNSLFLYFKLAQGKKDLEDLLLLCNTSCILL